MITDIHDVDVATATLDELVTIITMADADLDDGLNAIGFDWQATAKVMDAAKRELATRFGRAVGYNGVYRVAR